MHRVGLAILLFVMCCFALGRARPQQASLSGRRAGGEAQAGQQAYQQHCAVCHSIIPGATLVGPSLAGAMKGASALKPSEVHSILINGKGRMPSMKAQLSIKDTQNLLAYLKTL